MIQWEYDQLKRKVDTMPRVYWTCPMCEHEACAYDEVDHECIYVDEVSGKEIITEYTAVGDELARDADND